MRKVTRATQTRSRQKRPPKKRHREPAKSKTGQKLIVVRNEAGKIVYRGVDRRQHNEQVFFDSGQDIRRFSLPEKQINKTRVKALAKIGPKKKVLGKQTFASERNPKHRENNS